MFLQAVRSREQELEKGEQVKGSNKALERMPGSAKTSRLQSSVVGALPAIAQLGRWADKEHGVRRA